MFRRFTSRKLIVACAAAATLIVLTPLLGTGPSFQPDNTSKVSSLTGWHVMGNADWKAENGEFVGKPKDPSGGWLMLDKSIQDTGFYASFRCTAGCKTGVLFRAEKTPDGMKGVLVSFADGEAGFFRVTLDPQGKELTREKLRRGGGQMRIAPPENPNAPAGPPYRGAGRRTSSVPLPINTPVTGLLPDDWNRAEIALDANIVRLFLNEANETGGVADDDAGRYGPLALYVGGTGEVRFKDVSYKDLGLKEFASETTSSNFREQRLSEFYYAWGAGAGDFNHDGVLDVVAGPHIYFGPDYTKSREIYLAATANPSDMYTQNCWMQFSADFTGDGWPDVINANFTADVGVYLYVNPKGENRRWDRYKVVSAYQSEIGVLRDVDGDGKPELVYTAEGTVRYAKPDPANPTAPWTVHVVSEAGLGTAHGIGVGDINGDGRMDITNVYGWWEQPPAGSNAGGSKGGSDGLWTYHPQPFGRVNRSAPGGSVMAVYDVNGDGLNDVVTVLQAHAYGIAWFEQKRDAAGKISFVQHMISDDRWSKNAGGVSFSEPHGTTFADVDGDGIPDFIVGKRFWSHRDDYLDPDPYGQPVLYVYKTVRNKNAPGGAEFVPELINNRSGAGSDVLAVDLNKDGLMDVVTATRFGTFIFWGKPRSGVRKVSP